MLANAVLRVHVRFVHAAPRQGHEGLFQPSPGHLEVTERDAADDQITDGGVGVHGVDRNAGAADADLRDPIELGELCAVRLVGDEAEPPRGHSCLESGAGAVCHYLAVVEHDDPVGNLICLCQMVGGEEHCPPLVPELPHHSPEALAGLHVHRGGRLVEEHDIGIARNRNGEADPLGLATREAVRSPLQKRTDVRPLDDLVTRCRSAVEPPDETEGLVDADAGGQADSRAGLEHGTHSAGRHGLTWVAAENLDAAFLWSDKAE